MSKVDSSLGLNDTMPFGKHRAKTIEEIYKIDPAYLLWLRDSRKKDNGDTKFLAHEIHVLLDDYLRANKTLAKKHESWGATLLPQAPVTAATPAEIEPEEETEFAYAGAWGAF